MGKPADVHKIFNNFSNVDILIGALDENILTKQYFTASRQYHYDSLTWFVQKRKPIPMWLNLLHLCRDPVIHIGAALIIISLASLSYVLQQFEPLKSWDWNHIVFNGIGNTLNVPAPYMMTTLANKFLGISVLFCAIIFNTILSSFLISMISNPFLNQQITSIAEIVDGDFNLVGNQFAFNILSEQNEVN